MKSIKNLIFVLGILSFPSAAYAQMDVIRGPENFRYQVKAIHDIRSLDDFKNHYDGSILLYDDWMPAQVTMKSGKVDNYQMNYFIHDNSLLYLKGQDSIVTLAMTDRIKDIRIGNQLFELVTYTDSKLSAVNTGVFEVLYKGTPISIVKRYEMEFEPGEDGSGYKEAKKPTILRKSVIYYQPLETTFSYPVPMKKKEFYGIFGDKAKEVEAYAKKNKLKINEAGIIEMAKYYNTLK